MKKLQIGSSCCIELDNYRVKERDCSTGQLRGKIKEYHPYGDF